MSTRPSSRSAGALAFGVLTVLAGAAQARALDPRFVSGCAEPRGAVTIAPAVPGAGAPAAPGTLRRLVVRLHDDATGQPVAARVGVRLQCGVNIE